MKIVFDVTSCAKEKRGGIGTYGAKLVQACARVAPEHEYLAVVRPNRATKRHLVEDLLPGHPVRVVFDVLPGATVGNPDCYHGLGVRLPRGGRFPKVVTLHDLNVFEFPELATAAWRRTRQRRILQTVARADLVIAYSDQGARAITEHLGLSREKVRVVPAGVEAAHFARPDDDALAGVLARHDLSGRSYVLHVGTFGPRKNQMGLVAAFARAGLPADWVLVLGGPKGEDADALAERATVAGLLPDRLRLPGWIPEEDYVALLAGAGIYACPSLHEGFGLPVVEAQAAGVPVLCSDRGSLPETVGDVGLICDPTDEAAMATALLELATDADRRADLGRRGRERVAARFSWERVAEQTLAVHAEAAGLARTV